MEFPAPVRKAQLHILHLEAGLGPQDNPGDEALPACVDGCATTKHKVLSTHVDSKEVAPLPSAEPGMETGSLGTFNCWWQSFSKGIRTHAVEVVKLK